MTQHDESNWWDVDRKLDIAVCLLCIGILASGLVRSRSDEDNAATPRPVAPFPPGDPCRAARDRACELDEMRSRQCLSSTRSNLDMCVSGLQLFFSDGSRHTLRHQTHWPRSETNCTAQTTLCRCMDLLHPGDGCRVLLTTTTATETPFWGVCAVFYTTHDSP